MKDVDEQKRDYIVRAKAEMDLYLRSRTWVEKVESIKRMNVADRLAKEAMRKALKRIASEGTDESGEAITGAGRP